MSKNREQNCAAAVNPAVRLGRLVTEAHSLALSCRGFFVRSTRCVIWAGRVGQRKLCRPSVRSTNLHGSAHPLGRGLAGFSNRLLRTTAMCAPAPSRKTTFTKFFSCNPQQDSLFAINGDLSIDDALEQASCFLEASEDTIRTLCMDAESADDPINRAWPALYLVEISRAIVKAAITAVHREERGHA